MRNLNELVNYFVFRGKKNKFSLEKDWKTLKRQMEAEGYKVHMISHDSYFYTTLESKDMEVCSDSRNNLRPRNLEESLAVAALKLKIPERNIKALKELIIALGLDLESFRREFPSFF